MTVPAPHRLLLPAFELLRGRPSRAWSLIVTFYGDAVVPRGGSLWLGTLSDLFTGLGFGPGAVRTAMSRLAADGWIERSHVGRNSFYRLTLRGRQTFETAAAHIYDPHPPAWDGRLSLVLVDDELGREARDHLIAAGYGSTGPGTWIAPPGALPLAPIAGVLVLDARLTQGEIRRLADLAWPLARMAASYHHFLDAFAPLRDGLERGEMLAPREAMTARLLLIHEYRRIILRDPILPAEMLPEDWPGGAARDLCRLVYPRLLAASEAFLSEHGLSEEGALPAADEKLSRRFA